MDVGPAGIADTTDRGKTVEGVDHPVQKTGDSRGRTMEGIDHPSWKQRMHGGQTAVNENHGKINGGSPGRWAKVKSDMTDSRSSHVLYSLVFCGC